MGTLMIKLMKEYYPLGCDIENLLKYIAGKGKKDTEKISYIGARGLSLKYKVAAEQIMIIQSATRRVRSGIKVRSSWLS